MMFTSATSFKQNLCGVAWVHSKASQDQMFEDSPGSISRSVCKSASTTTRQHVSRQPIPQRELIGRTPISTSVGTPVITSTIASMMTCLQCGTFARSGRVSCCAPGGAWFKNCGTAGNRNADHSWFEGSEACQRKFMGNGLCMTSDC